MPILSLPNQPWEAKEHHVVLAIWNPTSTHDLIDTCFCMALVDCLLSTSLRSVAATTEEWDQALDLKLNTDNVGRKFGTRILACSWWADIGIRNLCNSFPGLRFWFPTDPSKCPSQPTNSQRLQLSCRCWLPLATTSVLQCLHVILDSHGQGMKTHMWERARSSTCVGSQQCVGYFSVAANTLGTFFLFWWWVAKVQRQVGRSLESPGAVIVGLLSCENMMLFVHAMIWHDVDMKSFVQWPSRWTSTCLLSFCCGRCVWNQAHADGIENKSRFQSKCLNMLCLYDICASFGHKNVYMDHRGAPGMASKTLKTFLCSWFFSFLKCPLAIPLQKNPAVLHWHNACRLLKL